MKSMFQQTYEQVNGNIEALLARKKMSVDSLSKRSGLARSTLYSRLKSANNYSLEELLVISRALNVSIQELFKEG